MDNESPWSGCDEPGRAGEGKCDQLVHSLSFNISGHKMALPDSVHSRVQSRVAALPAALRRKMQAPPSDGLEAGFTWWIPTNTRVHQYELGVQLCSRIRLFMRRIPPYEVREAFQDRPFESKFE